MPVFNGERWMARAVQSLLDQTFQDFELIIVDNASTDSSFELACALKDDPRVRVVRNETNIGLARNFRKAFALARGEYFMWASVDDLWRPEFIAVMVQELDQHPSATVAMSAVRCLSEDDPIGSVERFRGSRDPWAMRPLRLALELASLRKYNLFVSGLFRRSLLRMTSFPDSVSPERILLTELALSGGFRYVDEILHHRQLHQEEHERRYPSDTYARLIARGFVGDLHYLWLLFTSLILSPTIPWRRKALAPMITGMSAITRLSVHLFRSGRPPFRRQTEATIRWNDDALATIKIEGPFPDHGDVRPLTTTGVFRVRLSEDLVFVKALPWARAVPNRVPIAKLQWRDGELRELSLSGDFAEHGEEPPIEVEQTFKVYRTRNKVILRAVEDTPPGPGKRSD
jgi:glycosyltransferase involved in cell wall biosynthesis